MDPDTVSSVYELPALTFGIEFEFLIAHLRDGESDPQPDDHRPARKLEDIGREFLPALPTPADANFYLMAQQNNFIDRDKHAIRHTVAEKLRSVNLEARTDEGSSNLSEGMEERPETEFWLVKREILRGPVGWEHFDSYHWEEIEVVTPIYHVEEAGADAVKLGIQTLASNFRINTNKSCGLHIHIGNGNNGFSLKVLRNLMCILYLFEPQMQTIHPPERQNNQYCVGLRSIVRKNLIHRYHPHCKALYDMMEIMRVDSINGVVGLCSRDKESFVRGAVSMSNLYEDQFTIEEKRTIEFRQHCSTLDEERVMIWLQVVNGLVEFARTVATVQLREFLFEHSEREELGNPINLIELLDLLGLEQPARFYERRFGAGGQEPSPISLPRTA